MNRDGEECQHIKVFGCKVIYHIKYPDICIIDDEVKANSSQKSDGYIGRKLHVYERDFTSKSRTFNKENRFTLMVLTTLLCKPLMYCVIFKGE